MLGLLCFAVSWASDEPEATPAEVDPRALALYEERYVWFQRINWYNQYHMYLRTTETPFIGKYREPLRGARFYSYLGEPRLARQYRARRAVRSMIGWPSALATVGGLGWLSYVIATMDPTHVCKERGLTFAGSGWDSCHAPAKAREEQAVFLPSLTASAGTAGFLLMAAVPLHPAKAYERRRMVDTFNEELRAELGLP